MILSIVLHIVRETQLNTVFILMIAALNVMHSHSQPNSRFAHLMS